MTLLLYISLAYLLFTSVVLWMNLHDFKPLNQVRENHFQGNAPSVSVCIAARNEEENIERCVRSALSQQYPNFSVAVLDDGSTDQTPEILAKLADANPEQLSVFEGEPKPKDWMGKSWACQQLAGITTGEVIIFIDADTWLNNQAIARTVGTMGSDVMDFITLWPEQKLVTFWEKTVIPLVYFALLTLLPVRYVKDSPRWIPNALRTKLDPYFAAACGQFMAFKRTAYDAIGGHKSVKNKVVEDVELAKNIKRGGFSMNMHHGNNTIKCRMYNSSDELWHGFKKNFLAGFNYNIAQFTGMALLHFLVFILPVTALPFLLFWGSTSTLFLCLLSIIVMLSQRLIISKWYHWEKWFSLLHPVGVCWFQLLGFQVLLDFYQNKSTTWKDREI